MGRLEVRICGARNVGDTQKVGIPDPYVKILMGERKKTQIKYKTKVVNNSLNPVWNEISKFQIADYDSAQIVFEVWNDNVMVDDLMGSYAMSVNGLQRGVVHDMWAILTGTKLSSAEIHLQVLAVDFGLDPQPGSRRVSSIEEYISSAAPKPVMSATESSGMSSTSMAYDPATKPEPVVGIPLQAPVPPQPQPQQQQQQQQQQGFYAPPQPQQQQQPMMYAQQPVQYAQQPMQQQQQPFQYYQQPPQQQAMYMQQPPQPQPAYYQQGPPPPQPGYYGPSAPQPYSYGPTHL